MESSESKKTARTTDMESSKSKYPAQIAGLESSKTKEAAQPTEMGSSKSKTTATNQNPNSSKSKTPASSRVKKSTKPKPPPSNRTIQDVHKLLSAAIILHNKISTNLKEAHDENVVLTTFRSPRHKSPEADKDILTVPAMAAENQNVDFWEDRVVSVLQATKTMESEVKRLDEENERLNDGFAEAEVRWKTSDF